MDRGDFSQAKILKAHQRLFQINLFSDKIICHIILSHFNSPMNNSKSHKERSQLVHRTRLGLLEKHKDYIKRARDYHAKQDRLIRLRRKAAVRNKDEFYFSMISERTKASFCEIYTRLPLPLPHVQNGVHIQSRANSALPTDFVKVLKTQDENYVRTIRASGLKVSPHFI